MMDAKSEHKVQGLNWNCVSDETRLALTSVLGPFAVYLLEFILH